MAVDDCKGTVLSVHIRGVEHEFAAAEPATHNAIMDTDQITF